MSELQIGDRIKDNNPRRRNPSVMTVTAIERYFVRAMDASGSNRTISRNRVYTDSNVRRSGFSRIEP